MLSNKFNFFAVNVQVVRYLIEHLKILEASIIIISIPNKYIKLAVNHISEGPIEVFYYSLVEGIMPNNLKASRVTPIGKGGDPAHPSNFLHFACLHKSLRSLATHKFQLI